MHRRNCVEIQNVSLLLVNNCICLILSCWRCRFHIQFLCANLNGFGVRLPICKLCISLAFVQNEMNINEVNFIDFFVVFIRLEISRAKYYLFFSYSLSCTTKLFIYTISSWIEKYVLSLILLLYANDLPVLVFYTNAAIYFIWKKKFNVIVRMIHSYLNKQHPPTQSVCWFNRICDKTTTKNQMLNTYTILPITNYSIQCVQSMTIYLYREYKQ